MPISNKQRGFTLIELMVIIALVAIMAGIAVPSFTQFVRNNRVTSQADEIHRFFQYARGEAVVQRRTQAVTLNPAMFEIMPADRILTTPDDLQLRFRRGNTQVAPPLAFEFTANGSATERIAVLVCHANGGDWITQRVEVSNTGRVSQGLRVRQPSCQF